MNIGIKLLSPVSNSTRIRNCIEDYVASLHPFDLEIGWFMGTVDYKYPDKPDDGSTGFISFNAKNGNNRMKLRTARYLTRKCNLNTHTDSNIGNPILNDEQIRFLAEKINSLLWTDEELNNIELIRGRDITEAYNDEVGGSSCMTGCNSEYTRLYEVNPTRFEMLVIRSGNDSARAIVHKLDKGQKLLGVVYTTAEHLWDKMQEYAAKQNWATYKNRYGCPNNDLVMSDLNYCDGEIPYMDVLTSGKICGGLLTVSYNSGDFELQSTNGNLEGGYHCENCNDYIHEDDIYYDGSGNAYCEYCFNENFIHCPDCEEVVHNSDTIYIQDKEIYVCQHCADKNYYSCQTCGDYATLDDRQVLNDETYCENCFDDIADCCEDCNETFYTEDLTIVGGSGLLCADCATSRQEAERVIL